MSVRIINKAPLSPGNKNITLRAENAGDASQFALLQITIPVAGGGTATELVISQDMRRFLDTTNEFKSYDFDTLFNGQTDTGGTKFPKEFYALPRFVGDVGGMAFTLWFGASYFVERIEYFHNNGEGNAYFQIADAPADTLYQTVVTVDSAGTNNVLTSHNVQQAAEYLRMRYDIRNMGFQMPDYIKVYGYYIGTPDFSEPPIQDNYVVPKVKNFVGHNTFVGGGADSLTVDDVTNNKRVYQDARYFADGELYPNTSYGIVDGNQRAKIDRWAADGSRIVICLKEGFYQQNEQWKDYDAPDFEQTFTNASGTLTIDFTDYEVEAFDAVGNVITPTSLTKQQQQLIFEIDPADNGKDITIRMVSDFRTREITYANASGTKTYKHSPTLEAFRYGVKAFDGNGIPLLPASEIDRQPNVATFEVRPEDVGKDITLKVATEFAGSSRPIDNDVLDGFEAENYTMFEDAAYHYSAIYGPGGGDVNEGNKLTKLRLLRPEDPINRDMLLAFEVGNESTKNWYGRRAYWYPEEHVAMLEACYRGVKRASPTLPVRIGPFHDYSIEYFKEMIKIAMYKYGRLPWDECSQNHYSNDAGGEQHGSATRGVSPEEDTAFVRIQEMGEIRNRYFPNGKLTVDEFGYDTNTGSKQHVDPIGTMSRQEVQAALIIRSILGYMNMGCVDIAYQYMIRDVGAPNGNGLYAQSGLTTSLSDGLNKKFSWYALNAFSHQLAEYTPQGLTIAGADSDIHIEEFEDDAGKKAYVVWHSTSEDKRTAGFNLPIDSGISEAKQISFAFGSDLGNESALSIVSNAVGIAVSEMPTIIMEGVAASITVTQTYTITEGDPAGTPVYDIESSNDNVTFTISGPDADKFTIN